MKQIQPVSIWKDGSLQVATKFNMNLIYDNLENSANFFYELLAEADLPPDNHTENELPTNNWYTQLISGNINMTDVEYNNWDNSNDSAYTWGANKLSITII